MAPSTSSDAAHSLFFYGTLMAPAVLRRVTQGLQPATDKPTFSTRPAILPKHRRHKVRGAEYPAVVPAEGSEVRGTFVSGLTADDVWRLDIFEGDEYQRAKVELRLLPESGILPEEKGVLPPLADGENLKSEDAAVDSLADEDSRNVESVPGETYIWIAGEDQLEDQEWDFDEFVRENMWRWAGGHRDDIVAVDEAAKMHEGSTDGTRGRSIGGGFEERISVGS